MVYWESLRKTPRPLRTPEEGRQDPPHVE